MEIESKRLDFRAVNRVSETRFLCLDEIWCGILATWHPNGNRVLDSISIWMPSGKSIWHGLTWRGLTEATWKLSPLDSISNMGFFKLNALLFLSTLTHPFTLSEPHQSNHLPLSALSVRPSPSLSLIGQTLSLSQPHRLDLLPLSASPTSTHFHSPSHSLTLSASLTPTLTPSPTHSPS